MISKKINVVYLAAGYPTPDNPSHGIFNQRAANAIKEHVSLTVIQYRIYKPGRKFFEEIKEDGFVRVILSVPYSPLWEKSLVYFNNKAFYLFTLLFARSILNKADIVHASDGNLGIFASWLKRKFSFRLLVQFIGGDLNQDIPQFYKKSWMRGWSTKLGAVSFNSNALVHKYQSLFDTHPSQKVIYRGVDTTKFFPSAKIENPVFYFLGGLPNYSTFTHGRNTKGGMNLMEAWKKLDAENVTENIQLLFAGPDSDLDIVKDWRSKLKHPERVEILGSIDPSEVPMFHQRGNIALVPSLEEGLPNAAMEAAATGNLVIANAVGGIPEIITDKITGIFCETNDVEGLCQKMKWIIENPPYISIIGQQALENIRNHFSNKDFGKKYFEYYKQILQ
ncbi:MAG: glycosyltransferase family 4 protein [Ferruginibacter sp.]